MLASHPVIALYTFGGILTEASHVRPDSYVYRPKGHRGAWRMGGHAGSWDLSFLSQPQSQAFQP